MSETLITSEVDFETIGKHVGFLRVPHSVHRSAYGRIAVPAVVIVNREILAQTERFFRRMLHVLDMLPGYHPDETRGTRELIALGSDFAAEAGLFEPFNDRAEPVAEIVAVGQIHHPDAPWKAPAAVTPALFRNRLVQARSGPGAPGRCGVPDRHRRYATMTNPAFTVSLSDMRSAAIRLKGVTVRSPLLEKPHVNALLDGRLLIKRESLQRTGAFKIHGAHHRMACMTPEERARGAISYCSGNHALGLAQAARALRSTAVIVMPADVPAAKMAALRAMGAEIVTDDRDIQASADVIAAIQTETGRIEVPLRAHPQGLAGANTAALEQLEQARAQGVEPHDLLVPCGGGLTAATALVMAEAAPKTRVWAVEPEQFDDTRRALAAGQRIGNPPGRRTICNAIMTPISNDMTFAINNALLAGGLAVSDTQVRAAMRFAFEHFKLVTEPGAVVGLAAIRAGLIEIEGRVIATRSPAAISTPTDSTPF